MGRLSSSSRLSVRFLIGVASLSLLPFASSLAADGWKNEWDRVVAAAKKEGKVVIYGPAGTDKEAVYVSTFQQAYPEIRVSYVAGRLSEQVHKIMAEQRAGFHLSDLVFGGTDIPLNVLKPKGLLQPILPILILPEVLSPSAWFKKRLWFADAEEKYIVFWNGSNTHSAAINTNLVRPKELKSYGDLLNPKWKGKIVSQDPTSIGRARSMAYTLYIRQDLGPNYLRRLYGEMEIALSRDLRQMVDWLAVGKFAIALGGQGYREAIEIGLPVNEVQFEGVVATSPTGTDSASFLASASHPHAAKVYLNWLLSREGQTAFQKVTKANSLRTDISKEGIVDTTTILDENREYFFWSLEENKKKIGGREFKQFLESVIPRRK